MKLIFTVVLFLVSSCASLKEVKSMEGFYIEKVRSSASFLLKCDNIEITPHDYVYWNAPHNSSFLTSGKEKNKVANSYRVSGCKGRTIFLLVSPDRQRLCNHTGEYVKGECKAIQDSSFITNK